MTDSPASDSGPHVCPVCGYPDLAEPAYDMRVPSFEICSSCGTEYGFDDYARTHAELRADWVANGMRWYSTEVAVPAGWDPVTQLGRVQ